MRILNLPPHTRSATEIINNISNQLVSLKSRLDKQLQRACNEEAFNKLQDDNQLLKMTIETCEKNTIERDNTLAQTQKDNNVLKTRGEEAERKYKTQLAKIDSLRTQYDNEKDELSRCQKSIHERTSSLAVRCASIADEIRKNATEWGIIPDNVEKLNQPLYKLRKDLQCNKLER